jgi:hypothetical protein
MKEQFNSMQSQMQSLIKVLGNIGQSGKDEIAKQLIDNGMYKPSVDQ